MALDIKKFDKILKKYMNNVAENIKEDAKNRAPVRTGALRESIDKVKADKKYNWYIGSDLEYALFVEIGTRNMSAQPYLRPALRNKANYRNY